MNNARIGHWFAAACFGLLSSGAMVASAAEALEAEPNDIATLSPNTPHRFITGGFGRGGFEIFDGDSGKLEGSIPAGYIANLAIAPDNSQFFVSETYWAHLSRGKRDDLVSVFDARSLKLVKEIILPGRALAGKNQNFDINASGSRAYVYIMHPAASVAWVDLKKQVFGGTVEVPGCALVFPWGEQGFSSLCGDGSLATVTIADDGQAKVVHTKPFFDANKDPIFENSFVDRVTGKAIFLSYSGLVYAAQLGAQTIVEKPWSIQQAAGYGVAGTGVQELAWRPGGGQLAAYNKASGRLYVLMHTGNYWTHKQGGTEIWVLDTRVHALVSRFPLQPVPTSGLAEEHVPLYADIGVSQDDQALLYLMNPAGGVVVLDAASGEEKRKIEAAAGNQITVPGY
jgi:methylamine dehydrogenase heavy chain